MPSLEIIVKVYADQSGKSNTNSCKKKKIVFCYGQYLYRKSKSGTGCSVEENFQTYQ
jgi:hypothetical protein